MTTTRALLMTAGASALLMLAGAGCGSDGRSGTTDGPASIAPVSTEPGTTEPGTTGPATTEPATTEPSTTEPATTAPATSSTAAATTSTSAVAADPAAETLALAGTLHAEDYAAPWTQYSAGGPDPIDTSSCSYRPGGSLERVAPGASQAGPTMQFGDTGAFASSFTVVFPDEPAAKEYIGVVRTDIWGTCRAQQLEQYQQENGAPDTSVAVTSRANESLGQGGFEAYAEFHFTDPQQNITRIVLTSFYRLGRTVIGVNEEYGALEDAQATAFFDSTYFALSAAYDRVNAL